MSGDVATPVSGSVSSINLHGLKLKPNQTVLGGTDGWLPTDYTVLPAAPADVTVANGYLAWTALPDARTAVIYKDGKYVGNTGANKFGLMETGVYTVRATNAMGGQGEASVAVTANESGIGAVVADDTRTVEYYNLQGMRVDSSFRGVAIIVTTHADGSRSVSKALLK